MENLTKPIVMVFSGLDPSGGAGIQADIETLASIGCHCTPVVTALTAQDTVSVKDAFAIDSTYLIEQARAVLEDMPVSVFKLGMLGSVENVEAIHTLLMDYPNIPVVLDPVIQAGGGGLLATDEIIKAMTTLLLPMATVITPNTIEATRFATSADTLDACAQALMDMGCSYVFITGSHANTTDVVNTLYHNRALLKSYQWPRLPNMYHGSGCTLATSIAGFIACGLPLEDAIQQGQKYTWDSLNHGQRLGMGQLIPNRFYWAQHSVFPGRQTH